MTLGVQLLVRGVSNMSRDPRVSPFMYKRGDPVDVRPLDWEFSDTERNSGRFKIITFPDLTLEEGLSLIEDRVTDWDKVFSHPSPHLFMSNPSRKAVRINIDSPEFERRPRGSGRDTLHLENKITRLHSEVAHLIQRMQGGLGG